MMPAAIEARQVDHSTKPTTKSDTMVLPRAIGPAEDRGVQSMRLSGDGNRYTGLCGGSRLHQTNTTISAFVSVQFRSSACRLDDVGQRHGHAATGAQQHWLSLRIVVHVGWIHRWREDGIGGCAYMLAERRDLQPCSSGIS
jgi:hypothetical protein